MIINNKYELLNIIGTGSFGKIFKTKNIYTNDILAIKVEPKEYKLYLLKHETNIYNLLSSYIGFLNVKWYGCDDNNYYMVMDLLGKTINDVVLNNDNINIWSVCYFGIQMIERVRTIHNNSLIHRDIKPDNFLLGINDNYNILNMIDFGFTIPYIDENNQHIKQTTNSNVLGTPNYISIHNHTGISNSRRDDIESICYIILFMYNGSHLWKDTASLDEIYKIKVCLINLYKNVNNMLYNSIPIFLINIFEIVQKIDFYETPNYNQIISLLKIEMEQQNYKFGKEYNINILNELIT
jgi:serine/threonine protein kinase